MRAPRRGIVAALAILPMVAGGLVAATATANAEDNGVGATPALGWSSWSFVRHNPTAATIEAQADAMRASGLAKAGFQYVNVDDFWYGCPGSQGPDVDANGRWAIDASKFPSAGTENGIQAVADHVHADGLKFGLYVTPGISAQAVAQNTAIEGTSYHADDIAEPSVPEKNYNCKGMVGIDYTKPGAQAFIDSWAKQFASWGVDYVKIDGVGSPDIPDVQAWSNALRGTGRPIHLELSNSLNIADAATWAQYSNGWRTGGDVECYCGPGGASYPLTNWSHISSRFNQVANWQPYGGPGAFNDYDSLELGNGSNDGLTLDERETQMSLWSLASSPLILGTDLTNLDPTDLSLLKNTAVLRVDQDAIDASRVVNTPTGQVFAKTEKNGDVIVGLFNTSGSAENVSTTTAALGLPAGKNYQLDDLWSHKATETTGAINPNVPSHGVALYRITPARNPFVPPATSLSLTGLDTGTVTESFTDNGAAPVTGVDVSVTAPAGYTVTPTSRTFFGFVASGQTVQATFQVTVPPPTTLFGTGSVTAAVDYRWLLFPQHSEATYPVTLSTPVQAPLKTFTANGGTFSQVGSQLGIRGDGSDVYGATNQYGAIYAPGAEQDGTVATVEITAQQNTNAWAKAGIMVRNDITNANASPGYLILAEAPGHGYVIQWDANGDGQIDSNSAPNNTGLGTATYPSWLKLVRSGTSYTGYYSADDVNWTLIDTVSVPSAAATQDVGVFMTSHSSGTTGEVDFNNFATN
ncbi:MAG TPA: NEW3 domain-containing protein [Pseudonocardiaceae bacterium]|nr:NEW3 domain-containing protein [Pseudonocardiaceae bacterium]